MSVRKRKWVNKEGIENEAWVVDYVDQRGGRHLKTFSRKKEADAFAAQTTVETRQSVHVTPNITIAEAALDWLRAAEEVGLERSTCDQYRQHVQRHISPFIGATKLADLSVPLVREFESQLRANGRSEPMVRKLLVSLGSIVADAQERGNVSRNVVREMRRGRKAGTMARIVARRRGKLRVGVDIPTPEEVRAIVRHLSGRWRPLILVAIFTGLRASELRGLDWRNVDLEKGEVHVRERADRFNAIGSPKSAAGERTVPLTPGVTEALKEWKLQTGGIGLVFGNGKRRVESLANIINRGLIPPQLAAGITVETDKLDETLRPKTRAKYTGMHALRHFYASWCLNPKRAGGLELPPKVVQERMGHATIGMTMDVYGHLFPRQNDSRQLAKAERLLLG